MNNEAGTTEAADPNPPCLGGFGRLFTTWFEFTPRTAGTYQFSTCGAEVATALSLYTGAACGPFSAVPAACRATGLTDTDCGPGASGMLVSATAAAGQTLRVLPSGVAGTFPPNTGGFVPVTVTPAGKSPGLRVVRVEDPSGPPEGGSTVSITGSGFAAGSTVTFGGIPATDVFFGGSTVLTARTPPHPSGSVDVAVTVPGLATATLHSGFLYEETAPPTCFTSANVLCLNGGRFRVESRWRVSAPADSQSGVGTAVALTSDTGYFWFFSSNNIELVVKVVDGRAVNGKFWVFYGALSDVEYQIAVTDLVTGAVKVYSNPAGTLASVADTNAF